MSADARQSYLGIDDESKGVSDSGCTSTAPMSQEKEEAVEQEAARTPRGGA